MLRMLPPVGIEPVERDGPEYDAEGLYNDGPKRAKDPLRRFRAARALSLATPAPKAPVAEKRALARQARKDAEARRAAHPWRREMACVPLGARKAG